MKKKFYVLALGLFVTTMMFAQETFGPTEILTGTYLGETIPLREYALNQVQERNNPDTEVMVPNESNTPFDFVETTTVIPNLQTEEGKIITQPIEQNFVGSGSFESGFFPPDPTGAVGPDHYVHSVNSLVKIFDKTGVLEVGPVSLGAFLGIPSNSGDPIVKYDQLADRWVVSEFGSLNNSLAIGVSTTNDPAGTYNVYQYQFNGFPDYPKYGLWHDGYYGTVNLNGQTTQGFVMERDEMLVGGASPQILIFNLPDIVVNPNQVKSPEPASLLGTTFDPSAPGYITYLQDDGWTGAISFDHLKVWEISVDWNDINNSTISTPLEIATDPFDAGELFGNGNGAIRQPGTSQRLAGHGGIVSFPAYYRQFGTHNSWLITFNTFIDANETGGIRWIELRNDDVNDWSIFQEGTYSIADGHDRLMSSAAMDAQGNIAMGYTTASENLPVSLRYTGRFNGDPLGQMTVAETIIIDGPGIRNNSNRYGDYSHITMDPNDFTFWFTSDYFSSTNQWRTQVASFSLSSGFVSDVGAVDILQPESGLLTNAETVEINVRNFGSATQSNIPVELRVDGNLIASEIVPGPIASNDIESYTFTQTIDLSTFGQVYDVEVTTGLVGDQFEANNSFNKDVKHLFTDDVGALAITSPVTGPGLGMADVSIVVRNFGVDTQTNFDVQYSINGGTPVVETFTGSLASEQEQTYTFSTQGDFSALGTYTIVASTSLPADDDTSNDEATITIENVLCMPALDCSEGDGFQEVQIAEINNMSGCEGYGDFRTQIANLGAGSSNDITLTTGFGDQHVRVWIDFNDDFNFTNDETVILDYVIAPGEGSGSYTETTTLDIPNDAPAGEHVMRIKSNRGAVVINDPCADSTRGETEDYTVNIGVLGVNDFQISNGDFIITTLPNNQFEISLTTDYSGGVYLGVFNVLGQEVAFKKNVGNEGNTYSATLDMSNMSSGVYLVRMGGQTTTSTKVGRIIVK
tara:strand:+ start:35261 stop:38182 length:2922 start_codon:yes stop_codon:yes gene_type:complete